MNETKELLDAIEIIVNKIVSDSTTQIYSGVCQFVGTDNCTMLINGKTNRVKFYGDAPIVGKNYRVFVPSNNMSMAFIITGGGSSGTTPPQPSIQNYEQLEGKPSINNVTLSGNLSSKDLNLFGPDNPPSYPVTSVDGKTGAVLTESVKYTTQTLTEQQKQQARNNIGAGTSSFSGDYNDLTNKPTDILGPTGDGSNLTVNFTEDATLTEITSGSKLNKLFGSISKAIKDLIAHIANKQNPHEVNKTQVGLEFVDNVKQYSADNPPPYPVTSVDGATGAVETNSVKWTAVQEKLVSSPTQVPSAKAVVDAISASGGGDMLKANYATRSDTIVNAAFQDGAGNEINTTYTPLTTFNALYSRWPTGVATRPIANCHDITESGIYWVINGDPNRPPDSDYDYYVLAIAYSDIWMNLIGVDPRRNKMWIKNKNNGVFGQWNNVTQQILVQAEQPTGQSMGSLWYQVI